MSTIPQGPKAASAQELKDQIELERLGRPFLVHRSEAGDQVLTPIPDEVGDVWIGRSPSATVVIDWDGKVSGLHAQVEVVGTECTLVDDGLSTNGSFVNEKRVSGRRRLRDGDVMRVGETAILYRAPAEGTTDSTEVASDALSAAGVSPGQRRVLVELCRPYKEGSSFATPATNQQIADALTLSVDAVKTHLRALFDKFDLGELPQNRKRVALVERALQSGLISERDL